MICTGVLVSTRQPALRCVLQHPDTVGGAMMSGVREARRLLAQLRNDDEAAAAAYGSALPSKVAPQPRNFV